MRAHLDITDFEARTKIRAKYLRALEDEEWNLLPGYTFTKGFLRTYADMLGLDGRALVDEFKRQYRDPSEIDLTPSPSGRRDSRRARERPRDRPRERPRERVGEGGRGRPPGGLSWPPIVITVLVLVVLLAAALYALGTLGGKGATHTTTTRSTTTHTTSHTRTTKTPPPAPTRVALHLAPTGPVYVCLVGYTTASNAHGHVRINGQTLTPASPEPIYHADNHFLVTFGNNAITMRIDGHPHHVATSATPVSYEIRLGGTYRRLAPSAAPHCG